MEKIDLRPFQKVLVRDFIVENMWVCDLFSNMKGKLFNCLGGLYNECIPYEGNEHLLGTTDAYEPPYEPKDGDFVYGEYHGQRHIFIYKTECWNYASFVIFPKGREELFTNCIDDGGIDDLINIRPATKEEQQQLLDALHKDGMDWDADKREVIPYKWKPKPHTYFFYIECNMNVTNLEWNESDSFCRGLYESGNCFKIEAEADDKLLRIKEILKINDK